MAQKRHRVITELILDYLTFAKTIYVKDGKKTGEMYGLTAAFGPLKDLYGDTRVVAGSSGIQRRVARHG